MEVVMLDLTESQKLNILFLLLQPVNRGFSSQLSQLKGAVCFSTQTVYLSSGRWPAKGEDSLTFIPLSPLLLKEQGRLMKTFILPPTTWKPVCLSQVTLTVLSNKICFSMCWTSGTYCFHRCSLLIILKYNQSSSRIKKGKINSSVLASRYHRDFIHCFVFLSTICFASLPLKPQRKYFKTF